MLTSENAKENYLNFWNFCNYAIYNDIMGNNKNNFTQLDMELLFRRLNKSNNNKLTLHELSNELEWLNWNKGILLQVYIIKYKLLLE